MFRLSSRSFGVLFAVSVLPLSLAGCGGLSFTEVSGQVTYNGNPLDRPGGTISFLGPDGVAHSGAIDASGNYRVGGVCLGENRVSVFYANPSPLPGGKSMTRHPEVGKKGVSAAAKESPFATPASYAVPETSGLRVVVEKNTVYNPQLTGPNPK